MISYIALGANIEPREDYLNKACLELSKADGVMITKESSIYETVPVGYVEQADFLNMVIEVDTSLAPVQLLEICQSIEKTLGRKRKIRHGPRTIDLDILVYNHEYRETRRLTLPHPRMHERAFVLVPFSEIAPDFMVAGHCVRVKELLEDLPKTEKKDVSEWMSNRPDGG